LERLHALAGFHTGFAAGGGGVWARILNMLPLQTKSVNRRVPDVPGHKIHPQIGLELASHVFRALGDHGEAHYHWRNERFQRAMSARALRDADVIIGFDTSSWILAERCKAVGRPLIMVQTIGHPDAKAAANELIASQFPNWSPSFELRSSRLRHAEKFEHDNATLIVCSSEFTRNTLVAHGVAADKARIIPHGVDLAQFQIAPSDPDRPFRFIFVGSITARKGIPLLLDVWRTLPVGNSELWLVGEISSEVRTLLPDLPGLRIWGHVPSNRVAHMIQQCDVLVFPSYFEGFGLVILQAMACGLPVISTTATAAPDLIHAPGIGGWVLPPGDQGALEQAMAHCYDYRKEMPEVGKLARSIAERYSWQAYGQNWLPVLDEAKSRIAHPE
jgi:glycosyltransferase involved in cell wall biosynthesis